MNFLKKYNNIIEWLTILILTNLLSIYLFTSGWIMLPNTAVIHNSSTEFLSEVVKLNQLNNIINKNSLNNIDNKALGETLIDTMFKNIGDDYAEYYPATEYQEMLSSYSSTFGGIGVKIDGSDPNKILVTDTMDNSPAKEAGIESGDILIKINDEDIRGQDLDLVVSKTRGEIGTEVKITVDRNGKEISFNLTRAEIDSSTVYSENMDGIGYIHIDSFGTQTANQFKKELDNLLSQNISDLVIDLRFNSGGLVDSAVKIADELLDQDVVAYAVDKYGNRENYTTNDGKITIPYVILVNEYTASSSEILAGALQKDGTTLIGEKTFGKGIIQTISQVQDGSGYKLTTNEYFLNDDTKVNKVGITPNVKVALEEKRDENGEMIDTQLEAAINVLKNN